MEGGKASLQERGARTVTTINASFAAAQERVTLAEASAVSAISAAFAGAREGVVAKAEGAKSAFEQAVGAAVAQIAAARAAASNQVEQCASETATWVEGANTRYMNGVGQIYAEAKGRVNTAKDSGQTAARQKAQARGASAGGEGSAEKRSAATEVGGDAANNIATIAQTALGQLLDGADEASGGLSEGFAGLLDKIESSRSGARLTLPEIEAGVVGELQALIPAFSAQVDALVGGIQAQLDAEEQQATQSVEGAGATSRQGLEAARSQAETAVQVQVETGIFAMDELAADVLAQSGAMAATDPEAAAAALAAAGAAVQARVAAMLGGLGQAESLGATTANDTAGKFEVQTATLVSGAQSGADAALVQLDEQLDAAQTDALDQVDAKVKGAEKAFQGAVDGASTAFAEVRAEVDGQVNDALEKVRAQLGGIATECESKIQGEVSGVDTKIDKAFAKIDAETKKGFWEKVWDSFWRALLVGILVFVLPLAIIGALFSAKVALIVGLVVLAVAVLVTAGVRIYSLWKAGAPWYQCLIYGGLFLPLLGVADALGLVSIIEGATGYDLVTWQKLSEDERAHRLGSGLAGLVLLIVSLGIGRYSGGRGVGVEPPRVEPPRVEPPRGEIPKVEPPKTDSPKVEPPKTEPPKVEPPKTEPPKEEPPAVEPPKEEPPGVEPPKEEPPAVEPPKVEPPKEEPPGKDPPKQEPTRPSPEQIKAELHQEVKTQRPNVEKNTGKNYDFSNKPDARRQIGAEWERVFGEEYTRSRESGLDKASARTAANIPAKNAAKVLADDLALDAAKSRAQSDLQSGKAFKEEVRTENAQTQADFDAGTRGARARQLGTELDGKSLAEIQKILEADHQAGECTKTPDPIQRKGQPPLPQDVYAYNDGTVVRVKPGGDLKNSSDPMYSIEVAKDGIVKVNSQEDVAFKVDGEGRSVPKGSDDVANPYNKGTNEPQHTAWMEEVMGAGHRKTTEPEINSSSGTPEN